MVYIRIFLTIQRHKNEIQSMQIRNEAQSEEIKNFTLLIKSIVGIFYAYLVFLICYLPYFICMAVIRICGSSIVLKKIVSFLLDSHVSQFIFEPYNLQLEDETHSTRYHGLTTKDVLGG